MHPTRFAAVLLTCALLPAGPAVAQQGGSQQTPAAGNAMPSAGDALLAKARALFEAMRSEECTGSPSGAQPAPDVHTITYRPSYATDDAPPEEATLFRFYCGAGAYNEKHVYVLSTQFDGLRQLSFAEPELQIRYEDEDTEKAVEEMRIVGFTAGPALVNSDFVPEDLTIVSNARWRGLGDASSTGLWLFRDGDFTLVKYDVDPTYDGEINPETVLDYHSAP